MGLLKKLIKKGNPIKAVKKTLKVGNKARKIGNSLTKKALGADGGKGKHLKAGTRSGGKRAAARNARAATRSIHANKRRTARRTIRKA